jgi:TonB family protein
LTPYSVATGFLVAGLILAASALPAVAVWMSIPLPTLIKNSDLIVVGRLTAVHEVRAPWYLWWQQRKGRYSYEGTILIEKILWPPRERLSKVTFEWGEVSGFSESVPYGEWAGRPFLWLLQRRPGGKFGSNYPDRALPMDSHWTVEALPRQLGADRDDTPAVRAVRVYVGSLELQGRIGTHLDSQRPSMAKPAGSLPGINDYVYVEELPEAILKVAPEYPKAARDSGMQGTVIVKALIGTDGQVKDAMVVKSVPVLDEAAQAAVRKWRFKPAMASGSPVAVWVAVPVKFSLK